METGGEKKKNDQEEWQKHKERTPPVDREGEESAKFTTEKTKERGTARERGKREHDREESR